ncbi:MAG: tetraacyldisaccharide 4'-kinase [Puniceicoccales bacterium]|nr:tetraacyldisaccharide 4'-kinase [Puniceicoccales bacterium]
MAERFVGDIIYDRRCDAWACAAIFFLFPISTLFRIVVFLRRQFYRFHLFRSWKLHGCNVISVGNLTIGGTGKTPVVEMIARELSRGGYRVAILSRGYGSAKSSIFQRICYALRPGGAGKSRVVCDGKKILLSAKISGDEPLMLAKRLKSVVVIVDKNRVRAGRLAVEKFACNRLILDDGFQYLKLKKQLSILLIDCQNPFGNGHLIPRGILREPIGNIKMATHIFLTKSNGIDGENLRAVIAKKGGSEIPILECNHIPVFLQCVGGETVLSIGELREKSVVTLSGIANADGFEAFVADAGATIVHSQRFADHYAFSLRDVVKMCANAIDMGAKMIITTEKDAARFPPRQSYDLPIFFLRIEIQIIDGQEVFDHLVRQS